MKDSESVKTFPDQKQRIAVCFQKWGERKKKAAATLDLGSDEILYGLPDEPEAFADVDYEIEMEAMASTKEPYGAVPYADPGFRDGKKRYPIDTPEHVRSAHSYFSKPSNYNRYTPEQRAHIKKKIHDAWVRLIDSKGPPSDQ